jgi:hypothetical protein
LDEDELLTEEELELLDIGEPGADDIPTQVSRPAAGARPDRRSADAEARRRAAEETVR